MSMFSLENTVSLDDTVFLEDTVEERAQGALLESPIYDLRDLRVETIGGVLWINGAVSSYYHKQLAQEVVRAVAIGCEVVNAVDVM